MVILIAAVTAGCKTAPFTHSGLTETLTSDGFLKGINTPLGAKIVEDSLQYGGLRGRNVEFMRDFEVVLTSARSGELVSRLRDEALERIFATGASIHHNGSVAPGDGQLRDFDWRYQWRDSEGFIRVYSMSAANQRHRIVIYCYEHAN